MKNNKENKTVKEQDISKTIKVEKPKFKKKNKEKKNISSGIAFVN